ncbi:MAG: hypothetical protein GY696_11990 [Gammaproteobacteria bacterium]|nr:hypothetical protein [Gammaproteobacteria bacterium]
MIAKKRILDRKEREEVVRAKAEKRHYAKSQQNIPSPFKFGDIVQFKRPKAEVRKGQSPKSMLIRIISQKSKWDYRLADGTLWNARSLFRYRPARKEAEPMPDLDFEEFTVNP